jgi:gamma-D-glutamyl-L-lysine dipeptidyl-peptidase
MAAPDVSASTSGPTSAGTPGATWAVCVPVTTLWTSPDAPREIDAPILAPVPDGRGWAAALDIPARLDLQQRVLTQLLLGESVEVVGERGDWVEVVASWQASSLHPNGYPGWLPRHHIAAAPTPATREAVVAVESASLWEAPDGALVAGDVPYATILPALDDQPAGAGVWVWLPGGGRGWLDPCACVVRPTGGEPTVDHLGVLAAARRFVGLDYLWGGMSAFGLDCSGLVHLTFRALGRLVPRDAHDQAAAAKPIPLDEARPGDLYFFARPGKPVHHVGLVVGSGEAMLHAPRTGRQVVEEPLDDDRRETLLEDAGRLADDT